MVMSRRLSRSDWRDRWQLGDRVSFSYYDTRLHGVIVRTSSNPTYFHVEVNGRRYEVDLHDDDMKMEEPE